MRKIHNKQEKMIYDLIIKAIEDYVEEQKCSDYPKYYLTRALTWVKTYTQTVTEIGTISKTLDGWSTDVRKFTNEQTDITTERILEDMERLDGEMPTYITLTNGFHVLAQDFKRDAMIDYPWEYIVQQNPEIVEKTQKLVEWTAEHEREVARSKGIIIDTIESADNRIRGVQLKAKKPTLKDKKAIIDKIDKSDKPIYEITDYCKKLLEKTEE